MKIEKLIPEIKDNIWGGVRLIEKYGKITDKRPCAESWELSCHKDGSSRLRDGRRLSEAVGPMELGENAVDFPFFPMLIKLIDSKENLSVQVHPSDGYALEHEHSFGKTEMWYVVEADEGAGIYLGFKREVTRTEVEAAIKEERLTELLNFYPVKAGDCYFIPSGTIHAIGGGCLICEIQQNSNLTYRVYDYGRRDKNGNTRELHVDKALSVLNLGKYERRVLPLGLLGISKYFTVRKVSVNGEEHLSLDGKTFKSFTVVRGEGSLRGEKISAGDSFFIPANEKEFTLLGDMDIVLSEVRRYYLDIDKTDTGYRGHIYDDLGAVIISNEGEDEATLGLELLKSVNLSYEDLCK